MSYTANMPLTLGQAPQPVQVGATPPAGFTLINRGDNGGTVQIAAGRNGAQVPLTPGGSLTWGDPAVYPFASLDPAATAAETLVVTDQAGNYNNPGAVAAVTAEQLTAAGIPTTFLDDNYGTFVLPAGGSGAAVTVGRSASLVVGVTWPQPTPVGLNVIRMVWDDPAAPDLMPIVQYLTADNTADGAGSAFTWQVPVLAPRLRLSNLVTPDSNNAPASVAVVGNNRTVPKLRQLGDELGAHTVWLSASFGAGVRTLLTGFNSTRNLTRFNGPVTLAITAPGAGQIQAAWVDETGRTVFLGFPVAAGQNLVQTFGHPVVPVRWSFQATAAVSGNVFVFVTGNSA